MIKQILSIIIKVLDYFIFIPVIFSAIFFRLIRKAGIHRMTLTRFILTKIGVFPIVDHYYEPIFNRKKISKPLSTRRRLPGIIWNETKQKEILKNLSYSNEISQNQWENYGQRKFYFGNGSFESGDAEYLYNMIRFIKPKKVIEVGCGFSTLIIKQAIDQNIKENINFKCDLVCIEPYEQPWLESMHIEVLRKKVEEIDLNYFESLNENDMLFIDSSHMIRPQGDVLYELLEILPSLKKGVYVHIHDIFTPNDYPDEWVFKHMRFWNEQYLLEAFMSNNEDWEIYGALNYLFHNHYEELKKTCLYITPDREPGSFYIKKK